jgi:hypothetical protein
MCKLNIYFSGNVSGLLCNNSTLISFFFLNVGTLVHVLQVSGYTSSQPSTTTSASLTTSTTGNFDFLSPLTLAGGNNTGAGVEQDSNAGHKCVSRHDIVRVYSSILGNNQGTVSETLGGLSRATAARKQEQMNSSGSSNSPTIPSLQDQLFEITAADTVLPVVSNTSSQSFSIDVAGIKNTQLVHIINLIGVSTGVPMLEGT